jgi:hypothetical protein
MHGWSVIDAMMRIGAGYGALVEVEVQVDAEVMKMTMKILTLCVDVSEGTNDMTMIRDSAAAQVGRCLSI